MLPGRKAMTYLDSVRKSRDITLPKKIRLVKALVFQIVMYGCESWTIKKAECRRIDAFELCCWRRLLRVPWTAQRSNQFSSVQFSSVAQLCPTLRPHESQHARPPCHHQLPEFTETHVHRVRDAIQPSHPLSSPSPSAPNPSQHQSLLQ